MDSLYANGDISKIAFSTHFSQTLYESYIDFGLWRSSGMSDPKDIAWIPISPGYFYTVLPLGIQFVAAEARFSIPVREDDGFRPPIAILSTGLSYNLVPSSIQARFFELMLEGETYTEKDGIFTTSCSTRPANIEIMIETLETTVKKDLEDPENDQIEEKIVRKWIQFSGTDMIIKLPVNSLGEQVCIYNWLPNKDDFWVFG